MGTLGRPGLKGEGTEETLQETAIRGSSSYVNPVISKSCMHLNNRSFHILQRREEGEGGSEQREGEGEGENKVQRE